MFGVAIFAAVAFGYALVSRRLSTTLITGPIVFTLLGVFLGSNLLRGVNSELDSGVVQLLLEVTLVVVLFSDAAATDVRRARREASLPGRLLGIGMPLTILSGTLAAFVFFDALGFWEAAVVAVVLAPTDAALGKSIITNKSVPRVVRQALNVESGLNDGIAVPFLAITIAGALGEMQTLSGVVSVFVGEIGWAILGGMLVGWIGGKAILFASKRGWMSDRWRLIAALVLAIAAFGVASPLGGSGFLAAFVAGLTFGSIVRSTYPDICEFSDDTAEFLTMTAFFVFGAFMLVPSFPLITWSMVGFALVILTVARMIPVAISMIGTRLKAPTVLYLGWFGPRGLASLVFVGTVVVEGNLLSDAPMILAVVATVVATSVVLHGVSAVPLSKAYGRWWARTEDARRGMAESVEVRNMAYRHRIQGSSDDTHPTGPHS